MESSTEMPLLKFPLRSHHLLRAFSGFRGDVCGTWRCCCCRRHGHHLAWLFPRRRQFVLHSHHASSAAATCEIPLVLRIERSLEHLVSPVPLLHMLPLDLWMPR